MADVPHVHVKVTVNQEKLEELQKAIDKAKESIEAMRIASGEVHRALLDLQYEPFAVERSTPDVPTQQ